MRAAYIESCGGEGVLQVGTLPDPPVPPGQVRVRVRACALNHLDLWIRKGLPTLKLRYPHILGADGAGIVEKLGDETTGWKTGDEVIIHPMISCGKCSECKTGNEALCVGHQILGEHRNGVNAEFVVVPGANLFRKPPMLSWDEAAAIPLVFTTAWEMLVVKAKVKRDDVVLVHAAGSGVSTAAIQIAALKGAVVIATSSHAEKLELAKRLGASHTIHTKEQNFLEAVKKISKKGVDLVVDHVGQVFWEKNIKVLKWGGTLVTCGATSGWEAKLDLRQLFFRQLRLLGSTMGSKRDFPQILEHAASGQLHSIVDPHVFAIDSIAEAHRYLEEQSQAGKVVLRLDS